MLKWRERGLASRVGAQVAGARSGEQGGCSSGGSEVWRVGWVLKHSDVSIS